METIRNATFVEIADEICPVIAIRKSNTGNLHLYINDKRLPDDKKKDFINDFKENVEVHDDYMQIAVDEKMPISPIKRLVDIALDTKRIIERPSTNPTGQKREDI